MCEYVYIYYTIIKQKTPVFNLKLVLYIIANIIIMKVLCKLTTTVVIVVKAPFYWWPQKQQVLLPTYLAQVE